MKKILLLSALFFTTCAAYADQGLKLNLSSIHIKSENDNRKFNEQNIGLSFYNDKALNKNFGYEIGGYNNSYNKLSFYSALTAKAEINQNLKIGAIAGLVSGYSQSENPVSPFFAALTADVFLSDFGLSFLYIPEFEKNSVQVIGLQFNKKFN